MQFRGRTIDIFDLDNSKLISINNFKNNILKNIKYAKQYKLKENQVQMKTVF